MFGNDEEGFYSLDHPNYGNGGSFPNGTYTLKVDLRSQDGVGGPFPKNRVATGSLLASRSLQFTVNSPTGAREGALNRDLVSDPGTAPRETSWAQVLPNPVSNVLRLKVNEVKGQPVNVRLVDVSGRVLLQRVFVPEANAHLEEFEVSQMSSGMYFLQVHSGHKQAALKVLKVQ
jgi:hypothetical protein